MVHIVIDKSFKSALRNSISLALEISQQHGQVLHWTETETSYIVSSHMPPVAATKRLQTRFGGRWLLV